MKKQLEPFQSGGSDFLVTHPHGGLGDEPGLGKTIQLLDAAERLGLRQPLVIAPASVRTNWRREIQECGTPGNWTVASYEQVVNGNFATGPKYDGLIIDEEHFLKTVDSKRTLAIFGNEKGVARLPSLRVRWWATGTFLPNRPIEGFPLLKSLHPHFAHMTFARYAQLYCGAYFDGRGINVRGASRLDELSGLLGGFMLRRTKREVYPDRKEPLIHHVPLDIHELALADLRAEEDRIGAREAKLSPTAEDYSALGDTSRLLRMLGMAKWRPAASFIDDLLFTVSKVVVFAHHTAVIDALSNWFAAQGNEPVVFMGGMSDAEKDRAKAEFMENPDCRVFIGQDQASGTGLDGLQKAASTVVIVEPPWVPGDLDQMIRRLDRMEQVDDLVTAYVLHAPGTLDEAKKAVRRYKTKVIERVVRPTDPLAELK